MLHYLEQELRNQRGNALRATIENVSRRGVLGGLLTTTGLVLAIDFSPASAREVSEDRPVPPDLSSCADCVVSVGPMATA